MKNIFTGIQSSGELHLGNILGGIIPSLKLLDSHDNHGIFFIADLHSLTSIKDVRLIEENTFKISAAWLAMGLDPNKSIFFRQSKVSQVCELKWYLDCFTPFPMLSNAHAFKAKSKKLSFINSGLFTYPVLMASDILLYDSHFVPVGKDQKQHIEITRDIANAFNKQYGKVFYLPEAKILNENIVPGTDGNKMSKSYNNTINIFAPEKILKKQIMSIVTDSIPISSPKNYNTCNIFKIFKLLANTSQISIMKKRYSIGSIGYGESKKQLFNLILEKFGTQRKKYNELISNIDFLKETLEKGENKARALATSKIQNIRKVLRF